MGESNQRGWVTGAAGLLGSHILAELQNNLPGFGALGLTRTHLDLENQLAVEAAYRADRPDFIVHCAAYSDTTFCEAYPARAQLGNVTVSAHLADLAYDRPFIFFSSDLVFDGDAGDYDESAQVNPLSAYGRSKADAESIVLANPRHTVLRTSMTAGHGGKGGFDQRLINSWRAGAATPLFTDEFRNPIAASITAKAVGEVLTGAQTGLFHLAGAERLSRYMIGQLLAARYPELRPRLQSASIHDFAGQKRPSDCSMNSAKLQNHLSFQLPAFSDWVQQWHGNVSRPRARK